MKMDLSIETVKTLLDLMTGMIYLTKGDNSQ